MRARAFRLTCAAVALLALAAASTAEAAPRAATVSVTIENFLFLPNVITIDRGDTIRWTNLDSAPHNAVSIRPGFATAILGQGQTTTTTFDRPGTWEYLCGVHGQGMKGTVVVRGAPVAETPGPAGPVGRIVVDAVEDRGGAPLVSAEGAGAGAIYVWIGAAFALAAIGHFVWTLRRP